MIGEAGVRLGISSYSCLGDRRLRLFPVRPGDDSPRPAGEGRGWGPQWCRSLTISLSIAGGADLPPCAVRRQRPNRIGPSETLRHRPRRTYNPHPPAQILQIADRRVVLTRPATKPTPEEVVPGDFLRSCQRSNSEGVLHLPSENHDSPAQVRRWTKSLTGSTANAPISIFSSPSGAGGDERSET